MATTGTGVAAKIAVDSASVSLQLSGTNTHQITPSIEDVAGTEQATSTVLTLTAAANASGGTTVYTGTITGGGSNALVGKKVTIAGFATGANNGNFEVTASSTTTLTVSNIAGVAETHAGTATIDDVNPFKYVSRNAAFATVSASGLITGVAVGSAIIEVSYPTFDNSAGTAVDGSYAQKVYAEILVTVTP